MIFNILKDRFDILSPLDTNVVLEGMPFLITRKNDKSYISVPISTNNIQTLFECYNVEIPEIVNSLIEGIDVILVDVNTIQETMIKFYIITNKPVNNFPCTDTLTDRQISGFSILINKNNTVEQYKYYFMNHSQEVTTHRYSGQEDLIEENVGYISPSKVTDDDLAFIDERLSGIDTSNLFLEKTLRSTGDHFSIALMDLTNSQLEYSFVKERSQSISD